MSQERNRLYCNSPGFVSQGTFLCYKKMLKVFMHAENGCYFALHSEIGAEKREIGKLTHVRVDVIVQ